MTTTPTSDNDLFISYAHQGDNSSREAVTAWVARLPCSSISRNHYHDTQQQPTNIHRNRNRFRG